jgi:hypothetical protein
MIPYRENGGSSAAHRARPGESNIAENNCAKVLVSRDYQPASRYLLISKSNDVTAAAADIVTRSSRCPQLGAKL